jgi:hypothetical protein
LARLRWEIVTALDQAADEEPLARFYALAPPTCAGRAAIRHNFRVISDRSLIDVEGSESLRRDNAEIAT